jgi:Cu/Ag efflux pump CusA
MVTDRIFQGLAVALMSGAVVATLLTMIVVPILYWELRRHEFARVSDLEITNGEADARVAA